ALRLRCTEMSASRGQRMFVPASGEKVCGKQFGRGNTGNQCIRKYPIGLRNIGATDVPRCQVEKAELCQRTGSDPRFNQRAFDQTGNGVIALKDVIVDIPGVSTKQLVSAVARKQKREAVFPCQTGAIIRRNNGRISKRLVVNRNGPLSQVQYVGGLDEVFA